MSSPKEPGWVTPIMIVLVGGLAFYGITRGSGSCPATTSRSAPAASAVASSGSTPISTSPASGWGTLVHADDSNFDMAVLQADVPVLVDFYADWCRPCQRMAPLLDRIAEDLTDGRIVKVNVDNSPQLAARYNIEALPTMLVFVNGQIVKKTMGLQTEEDLRGLLQR